MLTTRCGEYHQVAADVIEEQGHWPLGSAAAPLLGQQDGMCTVHMMLTQGNYDRPQRISYTTEDPEYDPENDRPTDYSLDALKNGDGYGFDTPAGHLDGGGGLQDA